MTKKRSRVCLGAFAGAHGVKGETLVKTFTEAPQNIAAYGPVQSEDGARAFAIKFVRNAKPGFVIASAPEITSREDAASLKGVRFYVNRTALPEPEEDEFYLDDLVGLSAIDETGADAGRIAAVHNFGAGDLLELSDIPDLTGARVIPLTKEAVPTIDLTGGRVTVLRAAIDDLDSSAVFEDSTADRDAPRGENS